VNEQSNVQTRNPHRVDHHQNFHHPQRGGDFTASKTGSQTLKELLPQSLGGLPLEQSIHGPEAITGVIELHGVDFPLEDAAIGEYGNQGEITLRVSVEPDKATVAEINDRMTEKINHNKRSRRSDDNWQKGRPEEYRLKRANITILALRSGYAALIHSTSAI
jgi:hypothetical protein